MAPKVRAPFHEEPVMKPTESPFNVHSDWLEALAAVAATF